MTEQKQYSFLLSPNSKTRYIAGAFDYENREPHYELEVSVPQHVRSQVEVEQFLLGTPDKCQWGWDINNKSSWPAFITVKRNGILQQD